MKYTIIGAGKSGLAAALLARQRGSDVFVSESGEKEKFNDVIMLFDDTRIEYEFGGNTFESLKNTDCIIASPGVPPGAEIMIEAEKRSIPIISELEYAYQSLVESRKSKVERLNRIVAITGTNGKTTTTTLVAYILNRAGKKAVACGNIGTPLSSLVGNIDNDTILVVEASSFQLDRIVTFAPDIALILNITPDHLYYHGTMDKYIKAKYKIFCNQNENNLLILNGDDDEINKSSILTNTYIARFSVKPLDRGVYNEDGVMKIRLNNQHKVEDIMLFDEIRIPGVHNAYNSMAAALAARALEITNEDIRDSLVTFSGVEHRLEFVRSINGVDYIDDSKATNVNATWYALTSYKKPIIWIAGGRADSNDYSALDDSVRRNVKAVISIGEESDNIFNHFSTMVRCIRESSLVAAVEKSGELSEEGDVVLFTPACKSFDMFMNYEHRGEAFKEIVMSYEH